MAKEKVYVVIGLGTFGRQLCETFISQGASVIAVDNRSELIERIKDTVTQAVMIDATDEDLLSQLPFDDVDVAIVAIGDNIEASILVTALLKRMGITYILARAISDLHMQVLRQVGADEVVNLEIDEGKRIAQRLFTPEILDKTRISETISLAELYLPDALSGKRLDQLDLRKKHQINIVAVKRVVFSVDEMGNPQKKEEVLFPVPSTTLENRDVLLVVGKNDAIEQFKEEL
ncbi:MAG: TrkA family potassium uptake protein [Spirochaetia bacterium]